MNTRMFGHTCDALNYARELEREIKRLQEYDQWEKQILLKGLDALLAHYSEHPSAMHTPQTVQALRDKIAQDAKVDW